jgi:hypothetical protein
LLYLHLTIFFLKILDWLSDQYRYPLFLQSLQNNSTTGFNSSVSNSSSNGSIPANWTYVPSASYADLLFTTKSGIGWILALAMPTGWALLFVLCVIGFFSMSFIRKKGFFQVIEQPFLQKLTYFFIHFLFCLKKVFYFTHYLYIVYFILAFVHATHFWQWFLVPGICLIFEKVYTRFRIKSERFGETYIKDVNLLSSKVSNSNELNLIDYSIY